MTTLAAEKYSPEQREHLMDLNTSLRAIMPVPMGGQVATMGFPGLAFDVEGNSVIDPQRMQGTLDHSAMKKCDLLIVLLESEELPDGAMEQLQLEAAARSISLLHLPIQDYKAPDAKFERGWAKIELQLKSVLGKGHTVGLSCHYGAGRSGMMAASLLIQSGMTLNKAVETLRAQFPDSIESEVQMQWLQNQ